MAKRIAKSAPKGVDYYLGILAGGNPFVAVNSLVEAHNFIFEFDEKNVEIHKVNTEVSYKDCKGCEICDKIQQWVPLMTEWKLAKLAVIPPDAWNARTIARMYKLGMGYRAMAKLAGGTPKLEEVISRVIQEEPRALSIFIRCNLTNKQIMTLIPLDSYQLAEARSKYGVGWETVE